MELIVTTFLAIGLTFFGHLCLVIAHQFEHCNRPRRSLPEVPQPPLPPAKRSPPMRPAPARATVPA